MTTALVISTYKYSQVLNIILDSISKQVKFPDEIIIAEDGNDDKTMEVIELWKEKFFTNIIHVKQKDLGFRKALILNKAIRTVKSDYIIQIDGDCIPDKYFVKDHLSEAKAGRYLYGTRIRVNKEFVPKYINYYKTEKKNISFSFFSPNISKRFRKLRIPFLSKFFSQKSKISKKFRGCNTSFWRKDFEDVNGYNNNFKGWGREDSDLMIRFHNMGLKSKRLKFMANLYHLDHDEKDKSKFDINDNIQSDTIINKKIKTSNGLFQSIHKS